MKCTISIVSLLAVASLAACGSVEGAGGNSPDAEPGPMASAVSPDHGPLAGGNTVTITGTGFGQPGAGMPGVIVGGLAATAVTASGDGTVTFTAPAGLQQGQTVDVTVYDQDGFVTLPAAYRYNEVPIALSIEPAFVKMAGGTSITIVGRGFQDLEAGSATVTIGGAAATNVQVVDDHTLTAVSGAASGVTAFTPVDVTVSNANGSATLQGAAKMTKPGIIGFQRCCNSTIFYLDPTTADAEPIVQAQTGQIWGCTLSPSNQVFCAMGDPATGTPSLGTIDVLTGAVTIVGPLMDPGNTVQRLRSIAFAGSTLYGLLNSSFNQLYTINTATGAIAPIGGQLPVTRPANIASRDATSLYYPPAADNGPLQVLSTGGLLSPGPTMNGPGTQVYSALLLGSTLYGVEKFGSATLYTINPSTGVISPIGNATNGAQFHTMFATPSGF